MRLSDHLLAARSSNSDIGGIFTNVASAIQQAERFELTDDVARAGYNLTKSKPTSLLSAMPLCRAPYRKMWLEWRGGLTTDMIDRKHKRDPLIAPDPLKQGVLIETDASGQRGTMTFAWVHKERPEMVGDPDYSPVNVSPLGALFNWDEDGNVTNDAVNELKRRYPTKEAISAPAGIIDLMLTTRYSRRLSDQDAKAWMERSVFKDWSRYSGVESERKALLEMGRHSMPWIVPHTKGFFDWCAEMAMQSEQKLKNFMQAIVVNSWESDIEGEPPFGETIIAMMNSRNAIENRPVDLSALNKSRTKRGRVPFLPYQSTHLRLSQAQTRAFRAGLLSREDAGRHRVRGHFKIRKTGIYWWAPFFRGDPTKPLERQEYKVEM